MVEKGPALVKPVKWQSLSQRFIHICEDVRDFGSHSLLFNKGMETWLLREVKKMALILPSWYMVTMGNRLSTDHESLPWPTLVSRNQCQPIPSKQEPRFQPAAPASCSVRGKECAAQSQGSPGHLGFTINLSPSKLPSFSPEQTISPLRKATSIPHRFGV